jgi:LmbE family N-acetylglucosaminyl deacetylase
MMPEAEPKRIILLSPHHDDAALSLGGWLAMLGRVMPEVLGRILVVNVFSRSAYAPYLGGDRADVETVSRARAAEDHEFVRAARVSGLDLDFPDSSCVGFDDRTELLARAESDPRLDSVGAKLRELIPDGALVLSPLGVGNHIDHCIVSHAVRAAGDRAWARAYYEDVSYASKLPAGASRRLALCLLGSRAASFKVCISSDFDAKMRALRCYRSQLSDKDIRAIFFGARDPAPGALVERLWVNGLEERSHRFLHRLGLQLLP